LRVEMRVCEESRRVDIALGDSIDDNGNCREHNAEEHLGVQVVHGLHGPSAHDIVPKLRAGVAHALVEEVPEGAAVGQTQKNETGIRRTTNSTQPPNVSCDANTANSAHSMAKVAKVCVTYRIVFD
jgi:hypothetical protein